METTKKKMFIADLSMLLVAVIWGSGFIVTKNILSGITPIYMVAMRFAVATLAIGIFTVPKIKHVKASDLKGGMIIGLMLFLGFATQTIGIQYTTAGKSAFLTGTNVVMVPFISWFIYKKRPDVFAITAAVMCFIGVSLLTSGTKLGAMAAGDLWALSCALFFALHIITTGIFVKKINPALLTLIQFVTVTILAFIAAYFIEGPMYLPTVSAMTGVLYLGVFSTCVAFFIQTSAQKHTSDTHAAIILSLESLFGTVFGIIFLSEPFTIIMAMGCLIILLAIITAETRWNFMRRAEKKQSEKATA
jgi:drug/metabolite transporter (DMT)-like permease